MSAPYFSLIEWPKPFFEFLDAVTVFVALGAVGFRYSSLRGRLGADQSTVFSRMAQRAAVLGLLGAILRFGHLLMNLPSVAGRAKMPVGQFLTTPSPNSVYYYLMAFAIVGFLLASARVRMGWPLAAIGLVGAQLRNAFVGQWGRLITPMHILSGGLWLGTLFVLLVAGVGVLLRDEAERDARGGIVADLVNAFSPLALTCGFVLVGFGVWLALRKLHPFSALWTTAYGYTLIAKLCVVAVVFGLGAWNWRRQRLGLGTEAGAHAIRRSATWELTAATIVLVITSLLLSLPDKG